MKQKSGKTKSNFKIIKLNDIKGSRSGNFIIHLSKNEWEKYVKKIPVVEYDDRIHKSLKGVSFTPANPSNPDLGMFVYPELCDKGCKNKISPDFVFGRCDCPPDISAPATGNSSSPNLHVHECSPTISNGIVQCLGSGCIGSCTPVLVPVIRLGKTILYGYFICKCK